MPAGLRGIAEENSVAMDAECFGENVSPPREDMRARHKGDEASFYERRGSGEDICDSADVDCFEQTVGPLLLKEGLLAGADHSHHIRFGCRPRRSGNWATKCFADFGGEDAGEFDVGIGNDNLGERRSGEALERCDEIVCMEAEFGGAAQGQAGVLVERKIGGRHRSSGVGAFASFGLDPAGDGEFTVGVGNRVGMDAEAAREGPDARKAVAWRDAAAEDSQQKLRHKLLADGEGRFAVEPNGNHDDARDRR